LNHRRRHYHDVALKLAEKKLKRSRQMSEQLVLNCYGALMAHRDFVVGGVVDASVA